VFISQRTWNSFGLLWALVACTLVAPALAETPLPDAAKSAPANADPLVVRGKYLSLAADCMACHTGPGGEPYAGGQPLKSDYGTIYGPNITQDAQTGIGSWTKADFVKALRLGVSKDGSYIYPAMPYDAYTKLTDADMDALWAYMKTVKAVNHTPPKNTLPFPLTVRSGLAVWQSMYFTPGKFVAHAGKSEEWNRGAYLVEALGHCSDCHTPRNVAQGPETQHLLAGARISGWYAPDISDDPKSKLHAWTPEQLAHYLKTGTTPDNAKAVGPMQETIHDSLQYLKDADLKAMAVYLKQPATTPQAETASKARLPADRLAAGKQVYDDNCVSCHQADGKGMKGSVPALAKDDSVTAGEPYNVIMAILEGFPPQGSWGAMASFANQLTDDQIADVTNYVRTAWNNDATANATPWAVSTWRKNADRPEVSQTHALLCPSLDTGVLAPALAENPDTLRQAAGDRRKLGQVVGNYRAARPKSTNAEVVEALSTAYCRALAGDHVSEARVSAQIADFAQRTAVVLRGGKAAT
jgi:mono/diheme cytochrome c family protein